MSYNYLPLDRKWLHFQQVKNLLDFNQQVSITFDAHERILKSRAYLDSLPGEDAVDELQSQQLQNAAAGTGEEVPVEVVKLMLMLKIKSLSYGHSGVHIETVKRLMEMYNNDILPVIYTQSASGQRGDTTALSHLALPLIGAGNVYYKGVKLPSSQVWETLNWNPLHLQSFEAEALMSGSHFTTAYALLALKKADQLLACADLMGALSFVSLDGSVESQNTFIHSLQHHKGQKQTAALLSTYLELDKSDKQNKPGITLPASFGCVPHVHGAARDSFEWVLSVFLNEANTATESVAVFPHLKRVIQVNSNQYHLNVASDFLAIAINGMADMSYKRTFHLLNSETGLLASKVKSYESLSAYLKVSAGILQENASLCTPASITSRSAGGQDDFISAGGHAAIKALQVVNNVEKVLAIEMMSAAALFDIRKPSGTFHTRKLFEKFKEQMGEPGEDYLPADQLQQAIYFLQSYNVKDK